MKTKHNIEPIYDKNSQILILGTMPSIVSREKCFYYAHPQNRFWQIMENLFNIKLDNNTLKKGFLLKNNIALWDVIKSCEITGSSDSSIKNIKVNNLNKIIKEAKIKAIFCTGKKAYETFNKYFNFNIPIFLLPSPSSANASYNLEKLIKHYKILLNYLK